MRCEGMVRHGGALTFGLPYWTQCENNAVVMVKIIQDDKNGEFPGCLDCWKRATTESGIEVISAEPIKEPTNEPTD